MLRLAVAAAASCLFLASPASAGTFTIGNGFAEYGGADGQANRVILAYEGNIYAITDEAGIVLSDPDALGTCTQWSPTRVECARDGGASQPDLTTFDFQLGNGPAVDTFAYRGSVPLPATASGSPSLRVSAGSGESAISGSPGGDELLGGSGSDNILGNGGPDRISAGDGLNSLRGGDGDDFIVSGPGADGAFGEAGNDRIEAGSGFDTVDGGPGNDRLIEGTPPGCGRSVDQYTGGPGADFVQSFCGVDEFRMKDGERDQVICSRRGAGVLERDRNDAVADPAGRRCNVAGVFRVGKRKLGKALSRGLVVSFACTRACGVRASGKVAGKTVARGRKSLRQGGPGKLALRFTKRARTALAGRRKVELRLAVKLEKGLELQRRTVTLRR